MGFSPESSALLRRADRLGEATSSRFLCVFAALRDTECSVCRSVGSRKAAKQQRRRKDRLHKELMVRAFKKMQKFQASITPVGELNSSLRLSVSAVKIR